MTDFDLDRLGGVWRQQPDPEEMARLQRTAAAVNRRARLSRILDVAAGVVVSVAVILLVLSNPQIETFMMGAAAILVLLGSNIRQRKLRQVELKGLTGSTEDMLDQSIERVETQVRHNRFTLIAMGPVFAIAVLFAAAAERQPGSLMGRLSGAPLFRILWLGAWVAAIGCLLVFLIYAIRRGRRELERLAAMRESYRKEGESTAP
jgi:protein-S-isoprenylcysteine O-methyltransferase Ste14